MVDRALLSVAAGLGVGGLSGALATVLSVRTLGVAGTFLAAGCAAAASVWIIYGEG